MEGFLTVKEVAELVAKNQETIRRKIREKKLEAEALLSNKEGYVISISELIKKRFITKEQSESYLKKKNCENSNVPNAVEESYDQNSWLAIVSEYMQAEAKNIPQTIARLISETDKINKIRRKKNLELLSIKQTLEMMEADVEGLNSQVEQIVDFIEKLKYKMITGDDLK